MFLKVSKSFNRFSDKISYKDFIIFLIPFIVFMIYLFIYNPGILRPDTFDQFHQIATSEFNNWHPFFHTFIDMLCLKLYPDPKSIAILQILTFSTIWTVICNYLRNDVVKKENKFLFILQVLLTIIITLIPINAIFSISILKDTLFSYFLLFTCFLIKVLLDKKGCVGYGFIIILSLSMAFVAQIRANGIYLILIFLACLFVYLFKIIKSKEVAISIPILTIIFILLISSLNVVYDVEDSHNDAVFNKVVHMLADYDLTLDLSSEDRDKIHQLFNESAIRENYDITFSDPMFHIANRTVYDNDKFGYISLAIKYSIENPLHFLEYLFGSSKMVWNIVRGDDWSGSSYLTDTEASRDFFIQKRDLHDLVSYEAAPTINKGTPAYESLDSFVNNIRKDSLWDTLFNSPALYMYLSLILIGVIYWLTRSKDIFIVCLPVMLNILIIFVSTPIQDVRYLYSNLLLFYLLLIIFIVCWLNPKLDNNSVVRNLESSTEFSQYESYSSENDELFDRVSDELEQQNETSNSYDVSFDKEN